MKTAIISNEVLASVEADKVARKSLDRARKIAVRLAKNRDYISANDVRRHFVATASDHRDWQRVSGLVFLCAKFEPTGMVVKSDSPSRRGGVVRCWRLAA